MGTRSLTILQEEDGEEIFVIYRQFDGYPTGHGAELKEFLTGFRVVNGYGVNPPARRANGMSCLAAQVVAHFKQGIGGIYLHCAGTRDCGEEYIYIISQRKGRIRLQVQAGAMTFFGLPGSKQVNMPVLFNGYIENFEPEKAEEKWQKVRDGVPNDFIESEDEKDLAAA